jgi:hypothetical protein
MGTTTLLFLFVAASSSTSAGDRVRLSLDDCVPARDLVHDLVSIEIGFPRLTDEADALEVGVDCQKDLVRVYVTPNVYSVPDRKIRRDEVDAQDGSRLIALNITELLQDVDTEKHRSRVLQKRDEAPAAVAVVPESASVSTALRARLGAAPALRFLAKPNRFAIGGRASFGLDAPRAAGFVWSLQAYGGFEESSVNLSLGSVRVRAVSAGIGAGQRFDVGSTVALFALVGLSGGWAWIDGLTNDETAIDTGRGGGAWFGPTAAARIRFGESAGLSMGIEGGYTMRSVYGEVDDNQRVGLRGGWAMGDLAFDWSWGER